MKSSFVTPVCLALLVFTHPGLSASYYVAPTGRDTNLGTLENPFQTAQKGINTAQAGDVVHLRPGIYAENLATARDGKPGSPIIIDGGNAATIRRFTVRHAQIVLRNTTITGVTNTWSTLVYLDRGAHFCVLSNNVLDMAMARSVCGIQWRPPAIKPFGNGDAASDGLIISNIIRNGLAYPMLTVQGDRNLIVGNQLLNGGSIDFLHLFGRSNVFRSNICSNNFFVPNVGFHADFVQTFGNSGVGSMGHIIENNLVTDIEKGQLSQLEGSLIPEIRDWTFRNNIFIDIAATANCSIPGVKYYNNLFYRCNKDSGHALNFGSRAYNTRLVSSGAIESGRQYAVTSQGTESSVTYMAMTYKHGASFTGGADRVFQVVGDAQVYLQEFNRAHGARVFNNVFLECGDSRTNVGWYAIKTNLMDVAADYNYVAKSGFSPVRVDTLQRPIGSPSGWHYMNMYWWEPNGINGGDPGLANVSREDFRLTPRSILIDAGLALGSAPYDREFITRPQGNSGDIGPFEHYQDLSLRPQAPSNLRIIP
jgi:hypothetical protein